MSYDIHLRRGVTDPDWETLATLCPRLRDDAELRRRLSSGERGFLNLAFPSSALAYQFLTALGEWEGEGTVAPLAYHYPRVTREEAAEIAHIYLRNEVSRWSDPALYRLNPGCQDTGTWWVFMCTSQAHLEVEDPRAIVVAMVDKLDAHVWDEHEVIQMARAIGNARRSWRRTRRRQRLLAWLARIFRLGR